VRLARSIETQEDTAGVWTRTVSTTGFTPRDCAKTVSKPPGLVPLGLQLSERQIPQVVGFIRSAKNQTEPLERAAVLVRQAL
jgi:hypothetical protein